MMSESTDPARVESAKEQFSRWMERAGELIRDARLEGVDMVCVVRLYDPISGHEEVDATFAGSKVVVRGMLDSGRDIMASIVYNRSFLQGLPSSGDSDGGEDE